MAYNKEYTIFVLDVRRTTSEEFRQKATKCCSDIIKQKICCGKKDFLSFVLVGTRTTFNDMNDDNKEAHLNVTQYEGELQIPSWKLLMNFYEFVNETASNEGEWLDAVLVAFGMLQKGVRSAKINRKRIILFYDFNDGANSFDSFEDITRCLLEHEVEVIVVSENIKFIDNPANNNLPQAIFDTPSKKSAQQLDNEKYALRLVVECNAKLCNFTEALSTALKAKNKRPWTWNSKLRIGSKICINITGIIAAKDECTIKLKKIWHNPGEELTRDWAYFIEGNQVCPDVDELMDGYMMGGTPIAYDESVDEDITKLPPGLTFMGFIPTKLVYDEYFTGSSTYLILHQRDRTSSAKLLDGLVRELLEIDHSILCWKVFSEKFCRPRIVVLIPNKLEDDCPATLSMIEIAHHDQYHFFEFPRLTTRHTECSKEQLDAVDHLIDTMDLTLKAEDSNSPRETFHKDLLAFSSLPHIFERNFMDIMERKILCRASEDDEQFQEMLKDKNFVEIYWKLNEKIEKDAKNAIQDVKKVFSLNVSEEWQQKEAKAKDKANAPLKTEADQNSNNNIQLNFDHVRSLNPAEDFEQLLKAFVFPITDKTQRDAKFHHYACQLRYVVRKLILNASGIKSGDFAKVSAAISAYRKRCFTFNTFDDYNSWIATLKNDITKRRMSKFWNDVIVKHELGLCFIGAPSLDEQIKEKDFYNLEFIGENINLTPEEVEMNDTEMDDIMAHMEEGQ